MQEAATAFSVQLPNGITADIDIPKEWPDTNAALMLRSVHHVNHQQQDFADVVDGIAQEKTLAKGSLTGFLSSIAAAAYPVVLPSTIHGQVSLHVLCMGNSIREAGSTSLRLFCKAALTAADAVLVYIDSLDQDLPEISVIFQVCSYAGTHDIMFC